MDEQEPIPSQAEALGEAPVYPHGVDEVLLSYAQSEPERQQLEAVRQQGSMRAAAIALGIDRTTIRDVVKRVKKRAAQAGWAPAHGLDHELPEGLRLRGTSILYDANGNVREYWNKSAVAGREKDETVQLPDPKVVSKVSTLYDQQGRVSQQWVSERPEDKKRLELWKVAAEEMAIALPRADVIPAPAASRDDILVAMPVGDHHLGMLSWAEETGADWDLSIGERTLRRATEHLITATPQAQQALVVFLGDFMHYDSFESVTPTSKNLLDSDGRFPKMVRASIRGMRHLIESAAAKHPKVNVIVEIGNHDLSSSVFLMECLRNIYENNPRISIDTSPRHYHYFEFGRCLIGTHHGHGTKGDRLPAIMAADMPEAWGRTEFRYWWTGHIHHDTVKDYEKVRVESFRVLPPADAWAAQRGFRSMRDGKAIVLHRDHGEVARYTVNPGMFAA